MSFILRAAFWLTVLAFLLPSAAHEGAGAAGLNAAHTDGRPAVAAKPDMDAGEMLALAARSAEDVMGFCGRNADVCARGHAVVAHVANQTAFYGGKLFLWLTDAAREQTTPAAPAEIAPARPIRQASLAGA